VINLLPPEEKNKLKLERVKSLAIILSGMVLISLICFFLILLSVKFSILSKVGNQEVIFQQVEKGYRSEDSANLKDAIKKYNEKMPQVLAFYQNQVYFSDILADISEISTPQGIYFTNIFLDGQKSEGSVAVAIHGKSDSRSSLILFKKNIEAQGKIKNVSFSPESWISPTNISFSLNFDFLPKQEVVKNAN
jgi:hypothetical protein